jgi:hypothetical protein
MKGGLSHMGHPPFSLNVRLTAKEVHFVLLLEKGV